MEAGGGSGPNLRSETPLLDLGVKIGGSKEAPEYGNCSMQLKGKCLEEK